MVAITGFKPISPVSASHIKMLWNRQSSLLSLSPKKKHSLQMIDTFLTKKKIKDFFTENIADSKS
jgi:hypothetical protein